MSTSTLTQRAKTRKQTNARGGGWGRQRRPSVPRRGLFAEWLEDRRMLADDCYANLFAGPRLVSFDSNQAELLEGVFNALLPGTHVDATVADWNAVGAGNINVPDFLAALQADLSLASPQQALDANVTLGQILDAAADAVPADGPTAGLHAALLGLEQDLSVSELSGTIQLGDLLEVTFPDGMFTNVDINALNFVTGVIELFNYENVATTADPVTISGTVLNEPGVNTVTLWAQVIEPPIIDPAVYAGDQFYSAAVRMKLDVDLVDFTVAGTNVTISDLDLYVDVAKAAGTVTSVHPVSALQAAVTIDAAHGVADVYMGSMSDSLFFNRTHVINPATDLNYGTIGTVTDLLGQTLSVEAKGYAEGTAPFATALEFFGPFPESQTTGTSMVFAANAAFDILTTLSARVTLNGLPVQDPTSGIRNIVANAIYDPLADLLASVGDRALDKLGTGIGEMDVTINAINCPPVAVDDFVTTPEDVPVAINVLANDFDPAGGGIDPTTVAIVMSPAHGTVAVHPTTGVVTYSPALNYNGPDLFTYTVRDTEGAESNVATVFITVTPQPDPPNAANDAYTTPEDTVLVIAAPGVLGNDSDPDGDSITAVFVAGASHGTVSLNANGSFTYTPAANYNGPDAFTYKANDGALDSNVATVFITVTPVNDPPVAVNDAYTTNEDTPLTVAAPGILANDADVDGDPLTSRLVSGPSHGMLTLNANGSFTYTPTTNYNGPDSFTYQANDGTLDSNLATVNITVLPVNDPPVAVNDAYSTSEDTPLTVAAPGILSNDSDVEGSPLTAVFVSNPSHGTLTLNANGSFTYTPAANYNGPDAFTYRASDGQANSNLATVNITVIPVNDAPVAVNDAYSTNEDTTLNVAAPGILSNDSDVDGNPLTSVLISGVSHGTLTLNANGSFTYTPAANYNGPDAFTYRANDGQASSNVATVNITVIPVNDAPVAVNDAYSTNEDTVLTIAAPGVLANDSDVDGNPLTAVFVAGPSHGTVTLNANGSFTYTPAANYNGPDAFTYRANDGTANSNVATVNITVIPVNDPPVAVNDAYSTNEDTVLTIAAPGVLANDTDVEGNPLTAVFVAGPSHGTVTLNANGSFTYTPAANYNGPDAFTYRANDGAANSNVATVNITVIPVNDPPVAMNDFYSTQEDTPLTVAAPGVLANDSDVDGNPLTAVFVAGPSHGTVTLNANGSFTYTPANNYNGPDAFTYRANDGSLNSNLATVSISVGTVNDPPVAVNDSYTTNEDTPLTVAAPGVLANDSDIDGDPLTAVLVAGPSHGTVTLNANGSFTYTPAANYNGPDSFKYQANDGTATSNVATVSITVNPVNDAPVAVNDAYTTPEDTVLTIAAPGVLANDSDVDGNPLTSVLVAGPGHGTLTLNANGSFSYTPAANYCGADSFTYRANDGTTNSNVATVSLTVTCVNDAPVAANDAYTTPEDTVLTVAAPGVLANDTDADGNPLTSVLVAGPGHGTLTLNANGSFTYTPAANYCGADSFTYKANDGTTNSNVATVSLTVTCVNDAPVAVNDSYSTNEDTPLTVAAPGVLANDSDADGNSLTSILVSGPTHGTLTLNANGSFTYTPAANYNGPDAFTYKANDGAANSNIATASITVIPVNDAPVAVNDSYSTNEDSPLTVAAPGVLANDSDVDGNTLTTVLVSGPAHGTLTLNANGSFTYTPAANYNGPDSFTYQASDGTLKSNVATASITVIPVNDAPVAVNDAYSTNEDTALIVAAPGVLANDSDVEGSGLTAILVTGPSHGTLTLNANGSFTYTPAANYNGPDAFTYKANDGAANSNVATAAITVLPINDAPVAVNDAYSTFQNTTLTVAAPGVQANDSDVDSATVSSLLISGSSHGTLSLNANGSFTYTPVQNYVGPDSFTYRNNDGSADSNVATVSITVNPLVADLSLTMTVDSSTPFIGGQVVFTITVSNAGPTNTTGVTVTDVLPAGVSFVSSSASQGSYNAGTGVWTIGDMANGASVTLEITAGVTTGGAKTNTAEVSTSDARDPDSTPGNHVASEDDQASVTITPQLGGAQLTHTNTTIGDYLNGEGSDITQLEYGVKSGKISNVSPGVFFYYSSVTAPASSFTILVDQSISHPSFTTLIGVHQNFIRLYDANANLVTASSSVSNGDVTINVSGATSGAVYIVQVKYDSTTVVNQTAPNPTTVGYTWATKVNGAFVSQDGLNLVKKGSALVAGAGEPRAESSHLDLDAAGLTRGQFTIAVDVADAAQRALVTQTIAALNASLSPLGTTLVIADSAPDADISLSLSATTPLGGVERGILGFTTGTRDITLVTGWNWYLGADPAGIAANQYDFATAVTHELLHAVGLDHADVSSSLLYSELQPGTAHRLPEVPGFQSVLLPVAVRSDLIQEFNGVREPTHVATNAATFAIRFDRLPAASHESYVLPAWPALSRRPVQLDSSLTVPLGRTIPRVTPTVPDSAALPTFARPATLLVANDVALDPAANWSLDSALDDLPSESPLAFAATPATESDPASPAPFAADRIWLALGLAAAAGTAALAYRRTRRTTAKTFVPRSTDEAFADENFVAGLATC